MNGLEDNEPLIEHAVRGLVVAVTVAIALCFVGWLLFGCARPRKPETAIEAATYAAELESCAVQSSTCPGYVACRQRVAAAHGRSYTGRCVP